ncbi:MAG: putative membrane-bound dehydrogenase-like protein [Planctomycetota bacterium]|jgi:putative membrane-bound dehydrogenase-like protein
MRALSRASIRFAPLRNLGVVSLFLFVACGEVKAQEMAGELFDGKSLAGWSALETDAQWWRVEDGYLTGGSLEVEVPHNTFLTTEEVFQNFEVTFDIRIQTTGGFANSGFQIRSERVPGSPEIVGYQVDAGDAYWGCFYDESRRGLISRSAQEDAIVASIQAGQWNSYRIRAEGPRIQSWINGIQATDYTETSDRIPLDGQMGLQVHGGGKVQVQLRRVEIERLPDTANVMTWELLHAAEPRVDQIEEPWRSAEDEQALFVVPDGFEIELVASEEQVQKLVDIAFDDQGRMWGLTAAEYPIDANEDPSAAAKYDGNSKDQVVVFDNVWSQEIQKPRIFADGFAMPMAILPEGDGVLLAHGSKILRLHDDDNDGKADRREVVLDGFGIQDSHLMPHRFVRAPGGWIYVAQGAYNFSDVRTKSGEIVSYNKCKIGRFRRDGSAFEVVGVGLNNIWGFVIDRRGDMWIQEANDLGYPLVPFLHGGSYPGIGNERIHASAPWQPPISEVQMGGTGLSGLAHSEDRNGFPAPWNETFFVANPIMSSVQSLLVETGARPTDRTVRLASEFLTSNDKNFRPVAIHFGPDGCLYIVDWYNPIISHNEVSRDHPDRDKKSTRIWRIRHSSQSKERPLDVTTVAISELTKLLDSDSTWISRAAWHQLTERGDESVRGELLAIAVDGARRTETRILALWSLEDLGWIDLDVIQASLGDTDTALQREGARLSADLAMGQAQRLALLEPLIRTVAPGPRLAAIASLALQVTDSSDVALMLLRFLRSAQDAPSTMLRNRSERVLSGIAGEIAFERSLVRMALEERRVAMGLPEFQTALTQLAPETQLFSTLCAGGEEAAVKAALLLGTLGRRPNGEEIALLVQHIAASEVKVQLVTWLGNPEMREDTLRILMTADTDLGSGPLGIQIVQSLRTMTEAGASQEQRILAVEVARALRLTDLEADIVAWMQAGQIERIVGISALVELGCTNTGLFLQIVGSSVPGSEARQRASAALASVQSDQAFAELIELWPSLERGARKASIAECLTKRAGAERLLKALVAGDIELEALDGIAWNSLGSHLVDDKQLLDLQARAAEGQIVGLLLAGGDEDYADANFSLLGDFTVEGWMFLEPGVSNDDCLLALPNVFDLNFYDGYPRLWLGDGEGDVIVADRRTPAERWFHLALTRTNHGELRLYLDGQLNQVSSQETVQDYDGIDIGRSSREGNTKGRIVELRIWETARTSEEIALNYRLGLDASESTPGLVFSSSHNEVDLIGAVSRGPIFEPPPLQTRAEAEAEAARFSKFRDLASRSGDLENGRMVFARTCLACHRMEGSGGEIGPGLDGVGAKSTEGILRSILTPNAGVESGYRNLVVQTHSGELLVGYLASEDDSAIVLRRMGREDLKLERNKIESMKFNKLSLMPEGLLDTLDPEDVTDLLTYLKSR